MRKRKTVMITALLFLVILLSCDVYANDSGYDNSYDAKIEDAIAELQTEIPVTGSGITKNNVTEIMNRIWNTNPQFFYLEKWNYSYYPSTGQVTKLMFTYTGSRERIRYQREEIEKALAETEEMVDRERMTEEEIALALHDYLAVHVKYAYDDYLDGTVSDSAYNIYGALVEGEAVCQGYALAYEFLLKRYGLQSCGIAVSNKANHAWNVVKIGNIWYHVDVTGDDPAYDNLGQALHSFFLISTKTLLALEPERADYVTVIPGTDSCENAADDSFENGFWRESSAAMYYYKGFWYYADRQTFEIVEYDYHSKKKNILVEIKDRWPEWEDPLELQEENFCRIVRLNNLLYYSTPFSICTVSLDGKEETLVFSPDVSGGYLYGLGVMDNTVVYVLKTEFYSDQNETVQVIKTEENNMDHPDRPELPQETEDKNPAPVNAALKKQSICGLKSKKKGYLTVTWKKDSKADGYQVCCSRSKNFVPKKTRVVRVSGKKKRNYTFKKLKSKKKYYVRVRAYKKTGSGYRYGKYSAKKVIRVK